MTTLLEARSLVKNFGAKKAVDAISFTVAAGEVLGILGPNGAGKSTTMKMLSGFLRPTSGQGLIAGIDVNDKPLAAKARLGYLPEGAPAYGEMTARGFLGFIAEVRGLKGAAAEQAVENAARAVHLGPVMEQSIDTLSKGFRRRVGLAQAILHDPDVLILDEPTDGLDPNQKHEVRGLISRMAPRKAIVVSTHLLEEVEALCSRAIVIDHGRIVADGAPGALRARSRYHNAVRLLLDGGSGVAEALRALPQVLAVEQPGPGEYVALSRAGEPMLDDVRGLIEARGWPVKEITVDAGRLDDVFRSITTGDREARP